MEIYPFEWSTSFFKDFESFFAFTEEEDINGNPRENFIVWQGPGFYEIEKRMNPGPHITLVQLHGKKITTDEYIAEESKKVSEYAAKLTQARVNIIFAYQKQVEGIE